MLSNGIGILLTALVIVILVFAIASADTIHDLCDRADSLSKEGDHQAAIDLSAQGVDLAVDQYGPNDSAVLDLLLHLIEDAYDAQDFTLVDSECTRAHSIICSHSYPDSAALETVLYYWANANLNLRRFDEALTPCEDLVTVRRTLHSNIHSSTASALYGLGELYFHLNDDLQAKTAVTEAIRIAETCPEVRRSKHAQYVNLLGVIYKHQGDLLVADSLLTQAMEIMEDTIAPDEISLAGIQADLAGLYLMQDRFDEAESLLQKALETRMRLLGPEHSTVATTNFILAQLNHRLGSFSKAEGLLREAISINRKAMGPDYSGIGRILVELGYLYYKWGRFDEAQAAYDTAMTLFNKNIKIGNQQVNIATCQNRIGILHSDLGDIEYAESCILKALAIRSEVHGEDHFATGFSMVSLGQLYIKADRIEEAENMLMRGAAVLKSSLGPLNPNFCEANISLASLYALKGDSDRSREYYSEALDASRKIMRAVFVTSGERDKLNWINKYPLIDQSLLTFAASPSGEPWIQPALEMVLRGKCAVIDALAAERETAFCSKDPWVDQILGERANLCRLIANVSLGYIPESWGDAIEDSLHSLYTVLDSVESELSKHCSEFPSEKLGQDITLNDVFASIPDGTVFWEFVRYVPYDHRSCVTDTPEPRYMAFVLTYEGQYHVVDLGKAVAIDNLILSAREMIANTGTKVYRKLGAYFEGQLKDTLSLLYSMVCLPLKEYSQSHQTIIIAPDGALNLIPFEIMVDPSGSYVVETHTISYASSGRDLVLQRDNSFPSDQVVILSNPDFDGVPVNDSGGVALSMFGNDNSEEADSSLFRNAINCLGTEFTSLPYTQHEAERVRNSFLQTGCNKIMLLNGKQASEQALKSLVEPPRVIHLATHGFACPQDSNDLGDPMSNPLVGYGLVLAGANLITETSSTSIKPSDDGILTALEVSGLNLTGTELVTLSTCESGIGDIMGGEGVFGLRRSFTHAGAQSVVMSMWRVPDRETRLLMEGFYDRWLSGNDKQRALRGSALDLLSRSREELGHAHPLLWGGFVLTGNPN